MKILIYAMLTCSLVQIFSSNKKFNDRKIRDWMLYAIKMISWIFILIVDVDNQIASFTKQISIFFHSRDSFRFSAAALALII